MVQSYVTLRASDHRYFDTDGREYASVSKVRSIIHKPFDREFWSKRKAQQLGVSQKEVLAGWDKNLGEANSHGTRIHDSLETYGKKFIIAPENEELEPMIKSVYADYAEYYRCFEEVCLYHPELFQAGTADKILQVSSSKTSPVDIEDYKTNIKKGLQFSNGYGQYLLEPVSFLQDCNWNDYCLQLSIYGYFFETLTGRKIRNLWLRFIPPSDPMNHRRWPVPYMRMEAEAVCRQYRASQQIKQSLQSVGPITQDDNEPIFV